MTEEARAKLIADQKQHAAKSEKFDQYILDYHRKLQREGFAEAVKVYSKMKPDMAKDLFMGMEDREAMEYMALMSPRSRAAIIKKFQAGKETAKLKRILDLLANEMKVSLEGLR